MKGKRILSAVLSAALLLQLSPLAVFAEDTSLLPVTAQTVLTEPAPEEPTPEPAGEETALPEEPEPEETAVPMAAPPPGAHGRAHRRTGARGNGCAGRCGNACPGAVCGTHGSPRPCGRGAGDDRRPAGRSDGGQRRGSGTGADRH